MIDDRWAFVSDAAGLALTRDVECIACCKRKRDRCEVCHGTGRRNVRHELTRADAERLWRELGEAIGICHPGEILSRATDRGMM